MSAGPIVDRQSYSNLLKRQPSELQISDIIRLSNSGVKIDFNDIKDQVVPDYPEEKTIEPQYPSSLVQAFWMRWRRQKASRAFGSASFEGMEPGFTIAAHEHVDKVFVMFCPQHEPPFIIEDAGHSYPSDALMAKVALYEKVKP